MTELTWEQRDEKIRGLCKELSGEYPSDAILIYTRWDDSAKGLVLESNVTKGTPFWVKIGMTQSVADDFRGLTD